MAEVMGGGVGAVLDLLAVDYAAWVEAANALAEERSRK